MIEWKKKIYIFNPPFSDDGIREIGLNYCIFNKFNQIYIKYNLKEY